MISNKVSSFWTYNNNPKLYNRGLSTPVQLLNDEYLKHGVLVRRIRTVDSLPISRAFLLNIHPAGRR